MAHAQGALTKEALSQVETPKCLSRHPVQWLWRPAANVRRPKLQGRLHGVATSGLSGYDYQLLQAAVGACSQGEAFLLDASGTAAMPENIQQEQRHNTDNIILATTVNQRDYILLLKGD